MRYMKNFILAVFTTAVLCGTAAAETFDSSIRLPLLKAAKAAASDAASYRSAQREVDRAVECLKVDVPKQPLEKREPRRTECYFMLKEGLEKMGRALENLQSDIQAILFHLESLEGKDFTARVAAVLENLRATTANIKNRNDVVAAVASINSDVLGVAQSNQITRWLDQEDSHRQLLPGIEKKLEQIQGVQEEISEIRQGVELMASVVSLKIDEIEVAQALTDATMEVHKIQLALCVIQNDPVCDGRKPHKSVPFLNENDLEKVTDVLGFSKSKGYVGVQTDVKSRLAERSSR